MSDNVGVVKVTRGCAIALSVANSTMVSLTGDPNILGFLSLVPTEPSSVKDNEQMYRVRFFFPRSNQVVEFWVRLEISEDGFIAPKIAKIDVAVSDKNVVKPSSVHSLVFKGSTQKDFRVAPTDNLEIAEKLVERKNKLIGYASFVSTKPNSEYDFLINASVTNGDPTDSSVVCELIIKSEFAEQVKKSDKFLHYPESDTSGSCHFSYVGGELHLGIGDQYEQFEGAFTEVVNALRDIFGRNSICCFQRDRGIVNKDMQ